MSSIQSPKIVVIGAGVIGLSSAVCIQQCCPSAQVEIIAEKFTPHTTSDGSGGFWQPYALGDSDPAQVLKFSKLTYDYLLDLAYSPCAGEVGVQQLSGFILVSDHDEEDESVKSVVDGYRRMTPNELEKFPIAKSGFFQTTVQVDVTPYLHWLTKRFLEKGGRLTCRKLSNLDELAGQCDLVVNCCGLGARDLVKDDKIGPIRGQIWRVHAPWIKHFYVFKPKNGLDWAYILPGTSSIVVGGTAQKGDWRTEIDEENSVDIWKTALKLLPPLAKATPIKAWAGLRPTRTEMRLEREVLDVEGRKLKVVHNYGHGGSGITLHWGCALEATKLALNFIDIPHSHVHPVKSRI